MKKGFIYGGLGVLVIGGALFGRYLWVKKKRKEIETNLGTVPNTVTTPKVTPTGVFPLVVGSGMGNKTNAISYVKSLQKALNELAPAPMQKLVVDGKFGSKTLNMLNTVASSLRIGTPIKSVNKGLFDKIIAESTKKNLDNIFSYRF